MGARSDFRFQVSNFRLMSIPHPIPYQGSKRGLAQAIIANFPRDAERLIEPFAGSAAVSIAAAYRGKVKCFWLNDLNASLVNLWDEIVHRPQQIANAYEELWLAQTGQEREFYDVVRERFNQTHRPDDLLYLLARCVKGSVRYNTDGEFNQSPDNRRKGAQPDTMRGHIVGVSRLLKDKTTLTAFDYREVLQQATASDIVYMDPPYQGVCDNGDPRYLKGVNFDEFVAALRDLHQRRIAFIVSYDGRTGEKTFGKPLPKHLGLTHIGIDVGRSTQATLLGRSERTVESLYLSAALVVRTGNTPRLPVKRQQHQMALFEVKP